MELLPTTYTFKVGYMGASIQKSQNVASNRDVEFETVSVSFALLSSRGRSLEGDASFYASGWKKFGDGTTGGEMELLPTTYTFKVGYKGASIQKSQNVANDADVTFRTTQVTVNLYVPVRVWGHTVKIPVSWPIGGDVSFYASGWKSMGQTYAVSELLPTTYTFKVSFMGQTQQVSQNVSNDASVEFATTWSLYINALKQLVEG
jgi:hypothetical protein